MEPVGFIVAFHQVSNAVSCQSGSPPHYTEESYFDVELQTKHP